MKTPEQIDMTSPEKEEVLTLEYDQSVEDIDTSRWYKILYDPDIFETPLKFVSIERRGPDYTGDEEFWKDENGSLYLVLRTDFRRKKPKLIYDSEKMKKK